MVIHIQRSPFTLHEWGGLLLKFDDQLDHASIASPALMIIKSVFIIKIISLDTIVGVSGCLHYLWPFHEKRGSTGP